MEISEGFIGNATGGIGQGLAYVLPQSRSEQYAMQLAQQHSQQLAAQAAARLKRQQDLQDNLNKQFLDQKLPDFYAPYDKAVIEANKNWQKKAVDYSVQTGKSPFLNPDLMAEYNKEVVGLAKRSKDLGQNYSELRAKAIADNGDKYTDESITDVIKYEDLVKKNPMAALNAPMPQLKLRPVTEAEFDKLITPTPIKNNDGTWDTTAPNLSAIKKQVADYAISDPKFAPLLKKYGYDPALPDFPVYDKEGRKVWYTNEPFLNKTVEEIMLNPKKDEIIAGFQIEPDDPYLEEKLKHKIASQNAAMGKFVTERADAIASKVTQDKTRVYAADNNAMAHQRIGLARERENRLKEGDSANPKDYQVISKKFVNIEGREAVEFQKYVPVNPVTIGTSQIKNAYDIALGKNSPLDASGSYEITGIGYATRKGGKKQIGITLVDKDGHEYIINEGDVPLKTRNDKWFKAARKALGEAPSGKTTIKKETVSMPAKGATMAVQGGTAIFDGTKWVMKD